MLTNKKKIVKKVIYIYIYNLSNNYNHFYFYSLFFYHKTEAHESLENLT